MNTTLQQIASSSLYGQEFPLEHSASLDSSAAGTLANSAVGEVRHIWTQIEVEQAIDFLEVIELENLMSGDVALAGYARRLRRQLEVKRK